MKSFLGHAGALVCVLALVGLGCGGDDDRTTPGADGGASDGASGGDAARVDSGARRDSGPGSSDPCAANEGAIDTVGCNGSPPGPGAAPNSYGGLCIAGDEANPAGTCTNTDALCWGEPGMTGICLTTCEPSDTYYVTTGGCPMGSRCFTLDFGAFCFPDCNSGADCTTMECDGDGSCNVGPATPMLDGGVPPPPPDAGTDVDAGTIDLDAGV